MTERASLNWLPQTWKATAPNEEMPDVMPLDEPDEPCPSRLPGPTELRHLATATSVYLRTLADVLEVVADVEAYGNLRDLLRAALRASDIGTPAAVDRSCVSSWGKADLRLPARAPVAVAGSGLPLRPPAPQLARLGHPPRPRP